MGEPSRTETPSSADYNAFQSFVCTDPPNREFDRHRGLHHPRIWELETQSAIRNYRFPIQSGDLAIAIFDEKRNLTGACLATRTEDNDHLIQAIAVKLECRNSGIGSELLGRMLKETSNHQDSSGLVVARIHRENEPSQQLFTRFGFIPDGYDQAEPQYTLWWLDRFQAP
ncbi:GNAT family N-acetyltransferase [Gulosibacter chungangensis]|uniref:GNAT family N-acetyltransferase n=1 Tax=Gulosibacter chungangensis TaxID=979746 RepID=A0A7J5BA84_9MICO|nr:GNAT family N-acetyltransferase [Gulosibacter chungangensis]